MERTITELELGGEHRNFPEEEVVGFMCSRRHVRKDRNTGDLVRAGFKGLIVPSKEHSGISSQGNLHG